MGRVFDIVLMNFRSVVFVTDFFRELFEAASSRLRSPFLGSVALVFAAVNWQPLYYMFFADKPVRARLLYFDANAVLLLPVGIGIAVAVAAPWLRWIGAWLAKFPSRLLHDLQQVEDQGKRIFMLRQQADLEEAQGRLEEAKETRKIEAAKRDEAANRLPDSVSKSDLLEDLAESRADQESKNSAPINGTQAVRFGAEKDYLELTQEAKHLITSAASSPGGHFLIVSDEVQPGNREIQFMNDKPMPIEIGDNHRRATMYTDAIEILESRGYIRRIGSPEDLRGVQYEITNSGYVLADVATADF